MIMPRKRVARIERETPQARALQRAVDEELEAMLTRMPPSTRSPEEIAAANAFMDKTLAKAYARWDGATSEWRERQGKKLLARRGRYDKSGLDADGGRLEYAVHKYVTARELNWEPVEPVDAYAAHHAQAVRGVATAKATRSADATGTSPATDAPSEPQTPRKRVRASVTYVDPRLFDEDEYDDWND